MLQYSFQYPKYTCTDELKFETTTLLIFRKVSLNEAVFSQKFSVKLRDFNHYVFVYFFLRRRVSFSHLTYLFRWLRFVVDKRLFCLANGLRRIRASTSKVSRFVAAQFDVHRKRLVDERGDDGRFRRHRDKPLERAHECVDPPAAQSHGGESKCAQLWIIDVDLVAHISHFGLFQRGAKEKRPKPTKLGRCLP